MKFSGEKLDNLINLKTIDNKIISRKTGINEEDLELFIQGKKVPNVLECIKISGVLECGIWDFLAQVKK